MKADDEVDPHTRAMNEWEAAAYEAQFASPVASHPDRAKMTPAERRELYRRPKVSARTRRHFAKIGLSPEIKTRQARRYTPTKEEKPTE